MSISQQRIPKASHLIRLSRDAGTSARQRLASSWPSAVSLMCQRIRRRPIIDTASIPSGHLSLVGLRLGKSTLLRRAFSAAVDWVTDRKVFVTQSLTAGPMLKMANSVSNELVSQTVTSCYVALPTGHTTLL